MVKAEGRFWKFQFWNFTSPRNAEGSGKSKDSYLWIHTPAGTKILDNVDCFTWHNPPETHEWHMMRSRWVWEEIKKLKPFAILAYFLLFANEMKFIRKSSFISKMEIFLKKKSKTGNFYDNIFFAKWQKIYFYLNKKQSKFFF